MHSSWNSLYRKIPYSIHSIENSGREWNSSYNRVVLNIIINYIEGGMVLNQSAIGLYLNLVFTNNNYPTHMTHVF